MIYAFEGFLLDTRRCELRRGDEALHLEPQVYAILRHLVEQRDRLVPKDELLDVVWGHRFVSPATLNSRIRLAKVKDTPLGEGSAGSYTRSDRNPTRVNATHDRRKAYPSNGGMWRFRVGGGGAVLGGGGVRGDTLGGRRCRGKTRGLIGFV